VAKYATASTVRVTATDAADSVVLVGGASPSGGSGLSGLLDRVTALEGTLTVESPPDAGTRVRAEIPLTSTPGRDAFSGVPD
jgi:signal transduction histidine kinase